MRRWAYREVGAAARAEKEAERRHDELMDALED